ncbi:protein AGENET DOMAIN (AGD)-CONTAINING P1-like [Mercurialis annua]|uniref:protein AGENET DOMAIN (AGD)-CONTAINING P1-like n=1 Tax=Mercurialis annua TaxID=3986 RepID=UPI00215E5C19|nr:protein AGENET DOMAIN (AGD)-CONTAINING P1-like [Mercurialis annua]
MYISVGSSLKQVQDQENFQGSDHSFKIKINPNLYFLNIPLILQLFKKMNDPYPHQFYHQNDTIEINVDDEVFFPARIVEAVGEDHQHYTVQYLSLPVTEKVHIANMRPTPPELNDRVFLDNDMVDAYVQGNWLLGWLVGNGGPNGYTVFLYNDFVTHTNRIRFHSQWFPRPDFDIPLNSLNDCLPDLVVRNMS